MAQRDRAARRHEGGSTPAGVGEVTAGAVATAFRRGTPASERTASLIHMSDPLVTSRAGDTGGEVRTPGRTRRGLRTFAVAAVVTAVVASGLAIGGEAIFGNAGGAGPSSVGSSPGAYPGGGQHGNDSGDGSGQHGDQGAAKAKAARDRAASAAAKSRSSGS